MYKDVGRHKARPLQLLVGTCIQQPEDVFLQALVHKDVGRHKARPLQLLIIGKRMITWNRSLKFLHVLCAVNMLGNAE